MLFALLALALPPAHAQPWQALPADVVPVLTTPVGTFVVLAVEAPAEWSGTPALAIAPTGENGQEAMVLASTSGLPPELTGWKGMAVTVTRPHASCSTTVGELSVMSRMSWMEGFSTWESSPGCADTAPGPERDAACAAAQIAEVTGSERLLVGKLAGCTGDPAVSAGAFASAGAAAGESAGPTAGGAAIGWAVTLPETDPRRAEALTQIRLSASWQATQARWIDERTEGSAAEWQIEPEIQLYTLGTRTWVTVANEVGGCGDFGGSMWLAWELSPPRRGHKATWKPLADLGDVSRFAPDIAADPDGDGFPTFLNDSGIAVPLQDATGTMIRTITLFQEPWMGCAC